MHSARTFHTLVRRTAQGVACVLPAVLILAHESSVSSSLSTSLTTTSSSSGVTTANGNNSTNTSSSSSGSSSATTATSEALSKLYPLPRPLLAKPVEYFTKLQQDLWNFQFLSTVHCEGKAVQVPIDKALFLPTSNMSHDARVSSCQHIVSFTYPANAPTEDRHAFGALQGWAFGGVFDGHGGWQIADIASQVLLKLILQKLTSSTQFLEQEVTNKIVDSFVEMEAMIVESIRPAFECGFGDLAKVGSCVLVALKKQNHLVVANCGDCVAVLGSTEGDQLQSKIHGKRLNHEHNCREELERVKLQTEHPNETDVVVCKNARACYVKGRLQLTRSLGDAYLKYREFNGDKSRLRGRYIPEPYTPPYVSHQPEVIHITVTPKDRFLILGTDGLWDYVSHNEAAEIVHAGLIQGLKESEVAAKLVNRALEIAAQESGLTLAELKALNPGRARRSRHDDTTAVVMYF